MKCSMISGRRLRVCCMLPRLSRSVALWTRVIHRPARTSWRLLGILLSPVSSSVHLLILSYLLYYHPPPWSYHLHCTDPSPVLSSAYRAPSSVPSNVCTPSIPFFSSVHHCTPSNINPFLSVNTTSSHFLFSLNYRQICHIVISSISHHRACSSTLYIILRFPSITPTTLFLSSELFTTVQHFN
jgi:hypothetical protein